MLYTVSTISAPLAAVRDFVEGNLSSGADHMFVFLDAPSPEVEEFLDQRPCVTLVRCFDGYWQGSRPGKLAVRQNANANVVRVLLSPLPWSSWLAHLAVDECLAVDREALEQVDDDVEAVQLQPMEAVSAEGAHWRQWFKTRLGSDDLALLHLLGHVDEPKNSAYFYGSTSGRPCIRPGLSIRLRVADAVDPDGKAEPGLSDERFRMLHNGTVTLPDFIDAAERSGDAELPGGADMRAAMNALHANGSITAEHRQAAVHQLYERNVADPAQALQDLGLLQQIDPARHRYQPRAHSAVQVEGFETLLSALTAEPVDDFRPARGVTPAIEALQRAAESIREIRPDVSSLVDAYLARAIVTG
ncbi:glycosyltransferase family 2 protein [Paraoerskovia marina]|uniref:glycosyltransferase family 2 protein n=1 Tax=Paraoerskovia marina TaxID=545619 RepID=UPI0004927301|nr:glycosyltransferase family 2 protein [Paraoerskovia marina]